MRKLVWAVVAFDVQVLVCCEAMILSAAFGG